MDQLSALAWAGGAAVVRSVGTDNWLGLRQALARWIGQGDEDLERMELQRLDRTALELQSVGGAETGQVRSSERNAWRIRIEGALESLGDGERAQAVDELTEILARLPAAEPRPGSRRNTQSPGGAVIVGDFHGTVVSGDSNHIVQHTSPGPENDPDDDWPQGS